MIQFVTPLLYWLGWSPVFGCKTDTHQKQRKFYYVRYLHTCWISFTKPPVQGSWSHFQFALSLSWMSYKTIFWYDTAWCDSIRFKFKTVYRFHFLPAIAQQCSFRFVHRKIVFLRSNVVYSTTKGHFLEETVQQRVKCQHERSLWPFQDKLKVEIDLWWVSMRLQIDRQVWHSDIPLPFPLPEIT